MNLPAVEPVSRSFSHFPLALASQPANNQPSQTNPLRPPPKAAEQAKRGTGEQEKNSQKYKTASG
jgi:hypothetical protein